MPFQDSPWRAGTPCWTDLAVPDVARATEFYGAVIGWSFADTGEEFGHFQICQTKGKAAAGIGTIMAEGQPSAWTLYFATDDADASAKLVADNGGAVLAGPMDIPGAGRMAVCADPTGCAFGLWQAAGQIGAEIHSEPGSLVWEDGRVTDVPAARAFYAAVFGFGYDEVPGMALAEYASFGPAERPWGGLGGMMGAPAGTPGHWLVYFGVADVDDAVAAAGQRGGSVLSPAIDTPFGRMAILADPFGAVFAVHRDPPGQA